MPRPRMLHIVHLCPLYTPAIGGVEQCISRLSDRLAARGDAVDVWTTTATTVQGLTRSLPESDADVDGGSAGASGASGASGARGSSAQALLLPEGEAVLPGGVRVHRFPVRHLPGQRYLLTAANALPFGEAWQANTLRWSPLVPGLRQAAARSGPPLDIVLGTPLPFTSVLHAAWQLARRRGARFVLAPFTHLGRPGPDADRIRRVYLSPLNVRLLRRADRVLAQTRAERDALIAAGIDEERLVLGGAGVDPETCSGGDRRRGRERWGLGQDEMVIGHLANKSWDKGTVDLIDAAEALWQRGLNFRLLLAGQEMPTFTRRWASISATHRDRIVNVGTLGDEEKRDFFASIDIFALPSYVESFGISLLEAAVNEVPPVAYRLGGPAELFEHGRTALLPPAGDRDALMDSLTMLMQQPEARARLGRAARGVAAAHGWDDSLARVVAAYDDLATRHDRKESGA